MIRTKRILLGSIILFQAGINGPASAGSGSYDAGASDTEIIIGQTEPYSGPVSAYSNQGKLETAFFKMINEKGGVNGRRIKLISLDDAYSPPKTVEQTRRLVEQEEVLLTFGSLGTAPQSAVQKYLNQKGVPQLFVASGSSKWNDPQRFPWTMGFQPNYKTEAKIYAKYLRTAKPDAKIAVLYQNDDLGKEFLSGFREGLAGYSRHQIVAEASYEVSEPVIDTQVVTLKASGADVLIDASTPKFAAQAIRKMHTLNWKPLHFIGTPSSSIGGVFSVAGLEESTGIISSIYIKDPTNPDFEKDADFKEWVAFMKNYYPEGDVTDYGNGYAYAISSTLVAILRDCGDDLTRANVMRKATSMKNLEIPMLMPGIRLNTGPTSYAPITQTQLVQFDGKRWELLGHIVDGD